MKLSRFFSSIISLSVVVLGFSLVRAFLYEILQCKCDYYLPAYLIDDRWCGHCATCYWSLQFYLTKMNPPISDLQIPWTLAELQTNWESIMKTYEAFDVYPLVKEEQCQKDLRICESHMQKLMEQECKRLESSLKVGKQIVYEINKDPNLLHVFFNSQTVWSRNWTGSKPQVVDANQNYYRVKCPTEFYLDSYHFTLSFLLSTINIEYFGTMMTHELIHLIPQEQKKFYTCKASIFIRTYLFRNVSEFYQFCKQPFSKDKTFNGFICDLEDDPGIKESIKHGISELCKDTDLFKIPILGVKAIEDHDLDSHYEKECNLRKDCKPNSDPPTQVLQ